MNKKIGIIIGVCTVAAVAVIAALSVFFYKENKSGSSDKAVTNTDEGDNLADGQIFDYEKAGYISLGKYKGLSVDVEPEVDDIYGAMMDDATENEVSSKDAIKSGDVVNIDFTGKKDGKGPIFSSLAFSCWQPSFPPFFCGCKVGTEMIGSPSLPSAEKLCGKST